MRDLRPRHREMHDCVVESRFVHRVTEGGNPQSFRRSSRLGGGNSKSMSPHPVQAESLLSHRFVAGNTRPRQSLICRSKKLALRLTQRSQPSFTPMCLPKDGRPRRKKGRHRSHTPCRRRTARFFSVSPMYLFTTAVSSTWGRRRSSSPLECVSTAGRGQFHRRIEKLTFRANTSGA